MKKTNKEKSHAKQNSKKNPITKAEILRTLKFIGFSISAGVIQMVSFTILYEAIHWLWWPSYLISIILSVIWNFTFNRKFTFQSASNVPIAMMWTLIYYVAFVPVSVFGGEALENQAGWNGTLVTALMMFVNFITEFAWQRFFVFKNSIDTKPLYNIVDMKLSSKPFEAIKNGTKTVEMRVLDEKRALLKKGDHIMFTKIGQEEEKIEVKITKLCKFNSFNDLYSAYDKILLGYKPDETANPNDMNKYYSKEELMLGVLAIEIKKIN